MGILFPLHLFVKRFKISEVEGKSLRINLLRRKVTIFFFLNSRYHIAVDVLYSKVAEGDRVEKNKYQCICEGPGKP